MKRFVRRAAALLLLLCLTAALFGCGAPDGGERAAPATTEAPPPPDPVRSADALELDGKPAGAVWLLEDVSYLEADALAACLGLAVSEPTPGTLRLCGAETDWRFRADAAEAERADGTKRSLRAPVLQRQEGWFLPLSVPEELWDRKPVYDPDGSVLRYLRLEPGPEILFHGGEPYEGLIWGGVPVLSVEQLAEMTAGSARQDSAEDGVPVVVLEARDRTLCFRAGSLLAEADGAPLKLPAPALQEGESWYLPAAAVAEALGCAVIRFPGTGRLELWRRSEGPSLWFDGTGLGATSCFEEVPCVSLAALAKAAGGSLRERADELTLETPAHSLCFRGGEAAFTADGRSRSLPIPVLPAEGGWFVPVLPVAEALGLPAQEGEGLIFSRLEPRETVLWVDGHSASAWGVGDGPAYLRLTDALRDPADSLIPAENTACFTAFGRTVLLTGGSARITVDGAETELAAPVCAAGEEWYAPASGLLQALGLTELEDPDYDQVYYTHVVRHDELAAGYRVPVLMYHAVSDYVWGIPELFVSPSRLEEQLQALQAGGYTTITFEDLDRIEEIEKPVMLTFDDGYDDNYTELFPLLQKYQAKATVFVIVNDLGKSHKLKKAQVQEMSESGLVSIQSHTMSHNYLDWMGESELHWEHGRSRLALARITGKEPFVMCYPTGKNSAYSRAVTAQYYEFGLCMGGPCYVTGSAPYSICRYYVSRYTSLDTFLQYVGGETEP